MPENRLDCTFARLRQEKKAAFVAYLCAGDPSLEATLALVLGLEVAGVDVVELGLPFPIRSPTASSINSRPSGRWRQGPRWRV